MTITIRPYQPGDETGICKAHIASIQQICARDYPPHVIAVWSNRTPQSYVDSINTNNERFWVLEVDGEIEGFAGWYGDEIRGFYMSPTSAGKGLARKLFESIEQEYKGQSGFDYCQITSTVTAKPFYEKMGFTALKEKMHTFNDGITQAPVWEMRKEYTHA